ncbi:MAG: methyltransferase domain-containing protein [Verrucomicrobia bacterium]|nr:methyltransferase domain-containing protein [Verrucomicrobiota bacterium]
MNVSELKTKADALARRNRLTAVLIGTVGRSLYRGARFIWRFVPYFIRFHLVFGPATGARIMARYVWSLAGRSYYNERIRNEIARLGGADTLKAGSAVKEGYLYHDLIFPDRFAFPAHRSNSVSRAAKLKQLVRLKGRRVLDLGCSNGSMTMSAALLGAAEAVGIDYDEQAIRVAEALRDKYGLKTTRFMHGMIEPGAVSLPETDVLIWLSNWMWLVKAYGMEHALDLLYDIPRLCRAEVMVFESAADDGMAPIKGWTQDDIARTLEENTPYTAIRDAGPFNDKWRAAGKERNVFLCTNPCMVFRGKNGVIERVKRNRVRKTFRGNALDIMRHEVSCLKRLEQCPFFPSVLDEGDNWFEMEYAGTEVTDVGQLAGLDDIARTLVQNGIVHRDMNRKNLLYRNGRLSLIDFEWATIDGIALREEVPEGLGRGMYNHDHFDDAEAARKVVESFKSSSS